MTPFVGSLLVTGEAVALDLRLAALPSRVVARLLDALVQGAVLLAVSLLAAVAGAESSDAAAATLSIVTLVLALLVYPIALETLLRGRTLGKLAMGLRVVRDDGGPIAFRQAAVRGFATLADLPTLFVPSIVCMLAGARSKRLGDLAAGTVVVQERVPARGGQVAVMPRGLEGWAASLELSRLSDELAQSVRQFVSRAGELTPAAREDLGSRLVRAVGEVTAPPPPPGTPGWAFLAAVLAERRRRDELRLAPRAQSAAAAVAPYAGPGPRLEVPTPPPPSPRPGGFTAPS